MIYSIHWTSTTTNWTGSIWNGVPEKYVGQTHDLRKMLADFIKESENDTFMFVLVKNQGQYESWKEWLKEHGLEKLVILETTSGITNPVHPTYKHNLVLAIIQSEKHFQREQEKENN